jgi:hypothetical protein
MLRSVTRKQECPYQVISIKAPGNRGIITSRFLAPYNTRVALQKKRSRGATITEIAGGWRFTLQPGGALEYRLAQLDDYHKLARAKHLHNAPIRLSLRARASQVDMPGTWGFGLWNDPFGLSLGFGGEAGRLPALPNATWFFFASQQNFLSLRHSQPGNGQMVGVYRSPRIPTLLLSPGLLAFPLALIRPISRLLRRIGAGFIQHQLTTFAADSTQWHEYSQSWTASGVDFYLDGKNIYTTTLVPQGPLGLVLWLDNQYAAWRPDGRLQYGIMPTPANCWAEIIDLQISQP